MASLYTRRTVLPGTDLTVPYATVGTMMFGQRADRNEAGRIVDLALARGLDFFDTADMYADGESETILGALLRERGAAVTVATKVGYGKNERGEEEGLAPAAVRRAARLSAERLQRETLDVYYLHRPDRDAPIRETLATVHELRTEGVIRHFALSNFGAWQTYEVLRLCDDNGWERPVMVQMIYNLLVRQIDYEYTALCRREGLHLTVYNPLAGGLLTGKYADLDDEAQGGRFREGNTMYRKRYWSRRFFEGMLGLKRIADEAGMSLTHLALNWIAQGTTADSILLGPSNGAQLRDCLEAGDHPLSEDVLAQIDAWIRAFDGSDAVYAR